MTLIASTVFAVGLFIGAIVGVWMGGADGKEPPPVVCGLG